MSSHFLITDPQTRLFATTFTSNDIVSDSYDVIIKFHSAKNLPKMDVIGHADPYFIAKIDHKISYTSTIVPNTATPIWDNEEWIVRNIPHHATLTVKLYDKDDDKPVDDYIGRFVIHNIINYIPPAKGHKIIGPFGDYRGRFYLSIQSMNSSEETRQLPQYTFDGPCRYFRHNSLAIGRLTMLNVDCIYPTWKIPMKRISFFFPFYQRQYWNKQYKAAKNIFGNCLFSSASRSSIRLAHKILYGRTLKHNENDLLNNANDLWKLVFFDKNTERIRPCVYTYVIDDNTWRFSETGIQFFTDFASKHALLANCSEYVRYAGEFHTRPKHGWDKCNDEWELVFDNGSGTYAPDASLLVNLKELLLYNFPGLNVVTYDYNDPRLKESMKQLKVEMEKYKDMKATVKKLIGHYPAINWNEVDHLYINEKR